MKKHPAYKQGFNDGINYALKAIDAANLFHKMIAKSLVDAVEKGKK